jgi:hypothetical protein
MKKVWILAAATLGLINAGAAAAADGIECVAADLTQGTMEGLGAAMATQFAENPIGADQDQVDEFASIVAACAGEWGWSQEAKDSVAEYSLAYLGTRYAYNTLQAKKAFAIEPFYEFVGQLSEAEIKTALTTQVFGDQRQTAFIKVVVDALGDAVTQDDVILFHGFLMAQLKMGDAETRLKTM